MKWRKRAGSARKRGSKLDDVRDAGRRILLRILLLLLFPRNHQNFVEATMYNVLDARIFVFVPVYYREEERQ